MYTLGLDLYRPAGGVCVVPARHRGAVEVDGDASTNAHGEALCGVADAVNQRGANSVRVWEDDWSCMKK
jgi:hypothetical protein